MRRVLTVGLRYTGPEKKDVEFDGLGLCKASVAEDDAAYPLYEYDTIILNPQSYTHFLFGKAGEFSASDDELYDLKRKNNKFDLDTAFDEDDRFEELRAAMEAGTIVIWCLAEAKRMNFFGYRETYLGYLHPRIKALVKQGQVLLKKGRRIASADPDSPFYRYFEVLAKTGWRMCLTNTDLSNYESIAATPEGYSLGGRVKLGSSFGWLLTPPTSPEAETQLVLDSLNLSKTHPAHEKYHGIFLSHTSADKPFVRQLRKDLIAGGVSRVWIDEAEIEIGDSLIAKIEEGLRETRYIGVVLSKKSITAPWVKRELESAITREIAGGDVVVLPLLYEKCDLPPFLAGKLYADFTDSAKYDEELSKLIRRLRIR
jgi:hypothetical protein